MGRFYLYNTAIFLLLFSLSCKNSAKTYKPTTTVIEGQVNSVESPVIVLTGLSEVKATIDPDGKFFIQTELVNAGIYKLSTGSFSVNVFITPGDRIALTGDFRNPTTFKFKGDHANENNYLVDYEINKSTGADQDFQNFYTKNEEDFIKSVEERSQKMILHQQEYQKANSPFDQVFAEMIIDEISYDASIIKMNYPTYYKYLLPDSILTLSETYDSFLQNVEIDSEDKLLIPAYHNFLPLYLDFKTKLDTVENEKSFFVRKFENINTKFQNQKVRDLLLYKLLKDGMESSINDVALVIENYSKMQQNELYNEEINSIFNSWRHLLKGNPAPSFDYPNLKGKKIGTETLKGKVLYIDIWATWCGPCLMELPHLEKMQQDFKNQQDLVFLSISLDQDKAAWETMVKTKSMKGLQLIADLAWNSKIVSDYRISGIPRFIIIDKNGNIFNANAPRPSSDDIKKEINKALAI